MIKDLIEIEKKLLELQGQIQILKQNYMEGVELPPVIDNDGQPPEPDVPSSPRKSYEPYKAVALKWIKDTKKEKFFTDAVYKTKEWESCDVFNVLVEYFYNTGMDENLVDMGKTPRPWKDFKIDKSVCKAYFNSHYENIFNLMIDKCLAHINPALLN